MSAASILGSAQEFITEVFRCEDMLVMFCCIEVFLAFSLSCFLAFFLSIGLSVFPPS